MDAPAASIEQAYQVWCQCGQNLTETARVLTREHAYPISRQSLHSWKKKYDWEGRAAREACAAKEREDATSDDGLLSVLLDQKQKYEKYFESLAVGKVDNQALYAYNNLLKTILDVRERTDASLKAEAQFDRPKVFLENLEWIARQLKETDPAGLKILAANFDHLIIRFKAEHAQTT